VNDDLLYSTIETFNGRRFAEAEQLASRALAGAVGRDELFWMGLRDACHGFSLVANGRLAGAEPVMVAAMEKLRNFGFRYRDVEITSLLAGLRRGVEEIRSVQVGQRRTFDMSLLPRIKMARKADSD